MSLCTRILEFDAAHRVLEHKSKCRYLHGHRYKAEITVWRHSLDKQGMVFDFGDLKSLIGSWIDDNWDHNCILNPLDPIAAMCEQESPLAGGQVLGLAPTTEELFGRKPFILPKGNPTAEVLSEHLFVVSSALLEGKGVRVTNVRMWETPNCFADHGNPFFHPAG